MIRWIMRKAVFCILVIGVLYYLNQRNPQWMQTLGRWIGGEVGNRVSVAVGKMLDDMGEIDPLSDVVEVFREGS